MWHQTSAFSCKYLWAHHVTAVRTPEGGLEDADCEALFALSVYKVQVVDRIMRGDVELPVLRVRR